jgi:hypothetical protein
VTAWPASLPQSPLIESYEESRPKTKLRTQMDFGPAKMRRRFTANAYPVKATMELATTDTLTLDTFHDTTLAGGVLPFTLTHPRTGVTVNFRFVTEPAYTPTDDPAAWIVKLDLEIIPG